MTTRTIDLGLVTADQPEVEAGPAPAISWNSGRRYWWPAAGLALVLLLTVPAASPPPAPQLRPLLTVAGGQQAALTDHHVFVLAGDAETDRRGGTATVTAYPLADGAQRWQVPVPHEARLRVHGDTPLVTHFRGATTTTALDPHTGAIRWRGQGLPIGETAGRVLLSTVQVSGPEPADMRQQLAAVDARTGRQVWTMDTPGQTSSPDGTHLAVLTGDRLSTYDLATGQRLASTNVRGAAASAAVEVVGSQVLLRHPGPPLPAVVAYDVDTLDRQWRAVLPGESLPVPCGPVLCLVADGTLFGLDLDTGRPAWPPASPQPFRPGLSAHHLAGTDLLLLAASGPHAPSWIVRASSGELLSQLGAWVRGERGARRVETVDAFPGTVYQYDTDTGTTWVGRLHPGARRLHLFGAVTDTLPARCGSTDSHLACWQDSEQRQLQVWRMR